MELIKKLRMSLCKTLESKNGKLLTGNFFHEPNNLIVLKTWLHPIGLVLHFILAIERPEVGVRQTVWVRENQQLGSDN